MGHEDFSLKWFGIPDAEVVRFWKKLEKLPKITKEGHEEWKRQRKAEADYWESRLRRNPDFPQGIGVGRTVA